MSEPLVWSGADLGDPHQWKVHGMVIYDQRSTWHSVLVPWLGVLRPIDEVDALRRQMHVDYDRRRRARGRRAKRRGR